MERRRSTEVGSCRVSETLPLSRPLLEPEGLQSALLPGTLLSDRFLVEAWIARGGMGDVYRGRDLTTQAQVAIKVIARCEPEDTERFTREAAVLATFSHPGIVRYVAHGSAASGHPFLVMAWLSGRDLASHLADAPLTAADTWLLLRRICEALQVAHARGIVHRDLKPGNMILVDDDPASVTLLDFGVARSRRSRQLTRSGMVLGTIGYMAPEQALGELDLDARADVFSLGCLLYECLTGRPAFGGRHTVAVLSRLLSGERPRLAEHDPRLAAFDPLLSRLLARDKDLRPSDASEVLAALVALQPTVAELGTARVVTPAAVGSDERRLATVLLCRPALGVSLDVTSFAQVEAHARRALGMECDVRRLLDQALLVVLPMRGATGERALQGARLARAIQRLQPGMCVVVATGFAEAGVRFELDHVVERAAAVLRGACLAADGCAVDALTADLIRAHFELVPGTNHVSIRAEHAAGSWPRALLELRSACVGREKELALLDATWRECQSERVVRSVLVTAGPGMGKSRLASELIGRQRTAGGARVLLARGDALAAGSTLSLVEQLIMSGLELRPGASRLERQVRAVACFSRCGLYRAQSKHAAFLLELIGAPLERTRDTLLCAARRDPALMSEQKRQAFIRFIAALCARSPILIVVDDLQWGDLASVGYLEEALRAAGDSAIMVCALGRPEVHDQFPNLLNHLERQDIRLPRLTTRASERLVRTVLGADIARATLARIVRSADGNALHLEELSRHTARGDRELPESVLALAHAQLEQLPAAARRVLRAASAFGERCWSGGVQALVGPSLDASAELELLVRQELLLRSPESRFAGEVEYQVRQVLLREAAYAMLTTADRAAAQRAASAWLNARSTKHATVTSR